MHIGKNNFIVRIFGAAVFLFLFSIICALELYSFPFLSSSATIRNMPNIGPATIDSQDNLYVVENSSGLWIGKFDLSLVLKSSIALSNIKGLDITTDPNDNIWIAGKYGSDIWIGKFNSSLVLIASITVNGENDGDDAGQGIFVDSNNVWVTGFITTEPSTTTISEFDNNIWVAKYDIDLVLQSSAVLSNPYSLDMGGYAIFANDTNVFVAGGFGGCTFIDSSTCSPLSSVFWIAKYDFSLILQSSATFGGDGSWGTDISVDSAGNIYAVGPKSGYNTYNIWLMKFNSFLELQSEIVINDPLNNDDIVSKVKLGPGGDVWIVGRINDNFWFPDFTQGDLYAARFSHDIILKSSFTFDGDSADTSNKRDFASSIFFDSNHNLYIVGGINIDAYGGGADLWIGKFGNVLMPDIPILSNINIDVSTIIWNWSMADNGTSYYVINGSSQTISTILSSSTLSWAEINLSTNTAYTRAVVAENQFGVSTSAFITKYTLAAAPTNLSIEKVNITSATLSWAANDNPSYTRYEILQSTDNFQTNISTPVPINLNLTALTTAIYNLQEGNTYYFRIRAYNNNNDVPSRFSNMVSTFMVIYPVPDMPVIDNAYSYAISTNAINWSWTYSGINPVEGFHFISSTGGYITNLSSSTTFFIQTDLSPNTPSAIQVEAYYYIKSAASGYKTLYTLSNPPINSIVGTVHQSSATINWQTNNNPLYTVYKIYRSTDNINFNLIVSTTRSFLINENLNENTTYYWKIRSLNGDLISSDFDITVSSYFNYFPIIPSSGLVAISSETGKARLLWEPSPSVSVNQYNIYWDSGSGTMDYSIALSSVNANTLNLRIDGLNAGRYCFGLRAQNPAFEEKNTNLAACVSVEGSEPFANWIRASIKTPKSGKRLWGNRTTVVADIDRGILSMVKQVKFEYRNTISTNAPWIKIPAVLFNNPDKTAPYFVHWDITSLSQGDYELRAVAMNLNGNEDPIPSSIFVTINSANPDIEETEQGSGISRHEKVYKQIENSISLGNKKGNGIANLKLPSGTINETEATLSVLSPPAIVPPSEKELLDIGSYYEINLENGQSVLGEPAVLTVPYKDDDNDGIVDNTLARADKLAIMTYDKTAGKWKKESETIINKSAKTVSAQTSHFSLFGVFAQAANNLTNLRIYPVPYKPNDGIDDNGKPYNAGDPNSGIIFDNLTQSCRIEIYTVSGELVWKKNTDDSSGKIQWDVKNSRNRPVAFGVYIVLIWDTINSEKAVRKIVILK